MITCLTGVLCPLPANGQLNSAIGEAPPLADVSRLAFGEQVGGLRLGLAVWIVGDEAAPRLKGQIELWNSTTQEVTFPKGGSYAFELRISDQSGRLVPLWNFGRNIVVISRELPSLITWKLDPGARQGASFDLSNLAKFPAGGRYFFSAMLPLDVQTSTNAVERVNFVSGTVEFDVPPLAVSLTNPIPRRTNVSLVGMLQDPASAKTDKERDSIQKWNEAITNADRSLWPSNAAPAQQSPTGTPASKPAVPFPPMAEDGPVEEGGSRRWLVGIAAVCVAGIGFVILRRRRSGPRA